MEALLKQIAWQCHLHGLLTLKIQVEFSGKSLLMAFCVAGLAVYRKGILLRSTASPACRQRQIPQLTLGILITYKLAYM
jgi:hypothetical protein